MYEKDKLSEVRYFYRRIIEENENRAFFLYNLDAFIITARSVLQYALEEIQQKHLGQEWYDDLMIKSPVLSFFKDKRNFSIHEGFIQPRTDCNVMIGDTTRLSDSIQFVLKDKDGAIIKKYDSTIKPEHVLNNAGHFAVSKSVHKFTDWNGSEDVISLCKIYIEELENLVNNGIKSGFISG